MAAAVYIRFHIKLRGHFYMRTHILFVLKTVNSMRCQLEGCSIINTGVLSKDRFDKGSLLIRLRDMFFCHRKIDVQFVSDSYNCIVPFPSFKVNET